MSNPTYVVLDPAFDNLGGHEERFARALRSAAHPLPLVHLASKALSLDCARTLGLTRQFGIKHYAVEWGDPYSGILDHTRALGEEVNSALVNISTQRSARPLRIVVPTAGLAELYGVAKWLQTYGEWTSATLCFHRILTPWAASPELVLAPGSISAALLKALCRDLVLYANGRPVRMLTTTDALSTLLGAIAGLPFGIAPNPVVGNAKRISGRSAGRRVRILLVGADRPHKRSIPLPELVQRVVLAEPNVEFRAQIDYARVSDPEAREIDELCGRGQLVVLGRGGGGQLTNQDYLSEIEEADICLLPHVRRAYEACLSGSFADCAALGRPVVVPPGTTMAASILAGRAAGAIADDDQSSSFSSAILQCMKLLPVLQEDAMDRSKEWRRHNSPEKFKEAFFS
jgi:hypothetical protein